MKKYNKIIKEFTDNTNVMRYLQGLEHLNDDNSSKLFEEKYLPIIEQEKRQNTPFLSVIIRTQGKREDGLREALLCLNAQNNQNFEIILIAHKAGSNEAQMIEQILNEQEETFRKKIRYYKLNEGTRTTPLNFGFAHAWGEYAAVFDDDDILFDDWVESFYVLSKSNKGRILHSYAFAQNWSNVAEMGYRAESSPSNNYCVNFDLLSQLVYNRCPLMTLAFPLNMFQKAGIIFNEKLNVTEDWEYFMRLAFVCGVSDIENATAIYRFWDNIETSATLHDDGAWKKTYRDIQANFNSMDIILPANNVKRITDSLFGESAVNVVTNRGQILSQLYYSEGDPFNNTKVVQAINKKNFPEVDVWFVFQDKRNTIKQLRIDLVEEGMVVLRDLKIDVWFTNGEKKEIYLNEVVHNGLEHENVVWFLRDDPMLVFELDDKRILDVVHVTGILEHKSLDIPFFNRIINLFPLKKYLKKRILHRKGYF